MPGGGHYAWGVGALGEEKRNGKITRASEQLLLPRRLTFWVKPSLGSDQGNITWSGCSWSACHNDWGCKKGDADTGQSRVHVSTLDMNRNHLR